MNKLLILPVTWMATLLVTLGVETSLPATADTWLRGTGGANDNNKNASEVLVGNIDHRVAECGLPLASSRSSSPEEIQSGGVP